MTTVRPIVSLAAVGVIIAGGATRADTPIDIVVGTDALYLQGAPVDEAMLVPKLRAIADENSDVAIHLAGPTVRYGHVMQVMGAIESAGFTKVSLVAELPQGGVKP